MKHCLYLLFALLTVLPAYSQKEQDFAARYMQEMTGSKSGAKTKTAQDLQLVTISPRMLEEMMNNTHADADVIDILSHVKSIRIVSATEREDHYFQEAEALLKKNPNRYQPYTPRGGAHRESQIWMRKRKENIVELVMLSLKGKDAGEVFRLINITGNMDRDFIEELSKM